MKKTIQILGHTVEYECSSGDVNQYLTRAQLADEIRSGLRSGRFEYNFTPDTNPDVVITWRILEPKVLEVSGCGNCPISSWTRSGGVYCQIHTISDEASESRLFASCPLKKESITIKLKSNEPNN